MNVSTKRPSFTPLNRSWATRFASVTTCLVFVGLCSYSVYANSGSWLGTTDSTWAGANWDATPAPASGETATFNGSGGGNTTIDLGSGVTIATVLFDSSSAVAYTLGNGAVGSQTLTLNDTGAITVNSTVTASQLINANITLGTAVAGTTTFTNSTAAASNIALTVAGNITGGTGGTGSTKTLNIAGTGAVNLQGTINKGSASVINVANGGTGNLTLSGSGSSALGTLRATGGGTITVNNASANITVASSSQYGASSNFGKFILTAGTVAFNGGIQSATSSGALAGSDGMGFIVNGGTFSAANVSLGRSYNFSTTAGATVTAAQNMGTSGFQVNGGTATVAGAVNLAGSNSAANGQVSGTGSLTIGGELILGVTSTRTTLFQVTGGTLTNTDTVGGGIVIGKGAAAAAGSGELLLTGGVTTTEKISFGLNGGATGSYGNLTINGSGASLYVGSGGIVLAATNGMTSAIDLRAGTLGAKADWSSSMSMTLNSGAPGTALIVKAADATDTARNITLSGVLAGTGGFTKTGAGSLTLGGANVYGGATNISAGKLLVSGSLAGTTNVNSGGTLGGTGSTAAIILNTGGAVEAGTTSNDLAAFSLLWNGEPSGAFAQMKFELSTVDNTSDRLTLSGVLAKGAGSNFRFDFQNGGMAAGSYTLFTFSSQTGFAASDFTYTNLADGLSGSFDLQSGALVFTVIPEPGALVSLAGGLGCLLGWSRLRRRTVRLAC